MGLKNTCLSLLQMANRKVVIEEVLTERENYSKVILHKPMMLPKKDQKSEKEIDIRDTSRYVIISQWWKITQKSLILQFYERSQLLYLQRENSRNSLNSSNSQKNFKFTKIIRFTYFTKFTKIIKFTKIFKFTKIRRFTKIIKFTNFTKFIKIIKFTNFTKLLKS